MCLRGVQSADIFFGNVRVPAGNQIVPAGGFKQLMEAVDLERCGNTTMILAIAQSALDYVLEYAQERHQFGKPFVDFRAVQLHLAEMKMKCDAARRVSSCIERSRTPRRVCRRPAKALSPNVMPTK